MIENAQGELFAEFTPKPIEKPVKAVTTPRREEDTASIAPKVDIARYPKPKTFYTYDEYLKIHCGSHDAAHYWWERAMKSLEEDKKRMCR